MKMEIRVNRIKRVLQASFLFRMIQVDCLLYLVGLWYWLDIRKQLLSTERKLFLQR